MSRQTLSTLFGVSALLFTSALSGADLSASSGTGEVSGFAGIFIGPSGIGNHPLVGGGGSYYAKRFLSIGMDAAYAPLVHDKISDLHANANFYDVLGNVRLHIPTHTRLTPFHHRHAWIGESNGEYYVRWERTILDVGERIYLWRWRWS